jgi:tetratricopeptide (TPR) repeat protein
MVKRISYLVLFLQLSFSSISFSQMNSTQADEDAIKTAIMNETKSWAARNYEGMANAWVQEDYVLQMFSTLYYYGENLGWDSIDTHIKSNLKNLPSPIKGDITWSDWNIRVYEDCAWASYIQTNKEGEEKPTVGREIRFLEKKDGSWKFAYLNTVFKSDYQTIEAENDLNNAGYKLLENNQIKDAIDVFKMNVKLYPKSSNVYDSLGEAYMKNGDNELAVENYKKSLELDPKNDNAKKMINKLEKN